MYEAAASIKDLARATIRNRKPHRVTLAGYSYAMRHGINVQIVTRYLVNHLLRYGVTIRGNVICVYPPLRLSLMYNLIHFIDICVVL
jgi:hypothetical protein